jgi:signal transduction histidine kinase/CheY-like chemotaxis protein
MPVGLTHPLVRYGFAALTVAGAYALRRALDPLIGEGTPFVLLFLLPVLTTAWFAGQGPALMAAVLAVVVGDKISFDPSSQAPMAARITRVVTFLFESLLLSALIASRRRSVLELAESEQRYRVLTENFPNGTVLLFDSELRFLVAGGQGLSDLGLSARHLVGKTLREVFHEVTHILEPLYRGALAGHTHVVEVRWAEHDYLTYHVPVRDSTGAIIGGMVMTQDITQPKKLEHQLRQAQKMDAVGRLAGGIAHDFNNLLLVILGRTEMMLDAPLNERTLKSDLRAVADAAQRAADLTQQLLTFSRQQVLETRVLDLNLVLRELAPTLRNMVGERIELTLELSDSVELLRLNRGQIEQVVMNLCVNARDSIHERGTITLRSTTCAVTEGDAQHQDVPPGQYVCLQVMDSGSGMDELTREHLFEPYFTTKGRAKGSGLGLSIVHGIVGQHHGQIAVRSTEGRGSEFRIYLPTVEDAHAISDTVLSSKAAVHRRGQGEVILVVEDQGDVRKLLEDFLGNTGYSVLSASSAEEALAIARQQTRIDIIVTDMVLPQMTGYELCRVLASERPQIRTLLVSGYSEQLVGLSHLTATGTLFLPKPFTMSDLLERVDILLATLPRSAALARPANTQR